MTVGVILIVLPNQFTIVIFGHPSRILVSMILCELLTISQQEEEICVTKDILTICF